MLKNKNKYNKKHTKSTQPLALAQFDLGCWCEERKGANEQKAMGEAVWWWTKAAEQGLAEAQFNVAWCLAAGEGVVEDAGKAVGWLVKAADQGLAAAMLNLAHHHEDNTKGDPKEALRWFRKAAHASLGVDPDATHAKLRSGRLRARRMSVRGPSDVSLVST